MSFSKYVAHSGDYSLVNLIFLSPYGIPLFVFLAWLVNKGAKAVIAKKT
jgi:hypothetical protein